MHFNVYFDDETGEQLNAAATQVGETRNAVIRQAVQEWLARRGEPQQWPQAVLAHTGDSQLPSFELGREHLGPVPLDPLA